jgi:hypothetical protein
VAARRSPPGRVAQPVAALTRAGRRQSPGRAGRAVAVLNRDIGHLSRGRAARAVTALAVATGAGTWAAIRAGPPRGLSLLVALAVALLAGGLASRRPTLLAAAGGGLATAFFVGQVGEPIAVGSTALFAVTLVVVLELAWWSIELVVPTIWDRSAIRRRWLTLIAVAAAGGALALAVGVAGVAGRDGSVALFAVAVAGAPAATWAVVRATRAAMRGSA